MPSTHGRNTQIFSETKSEYIEHVDDVTDKVLEKGAREDLDKFGSHAKTDPAEIALVKKLDWYMMPMLWFAYFLNFLDRNAIVNARLNGLSEDLNMKGTQYNTCISILFVGYLLGQVPSNMLLTRIKPGAYISVFLGLWGIVSMLTFLAKDYHGMLVCRFLLGITEAPFYPGAIFVISLFYTRKETATRMAILYTGNMFASSFSSLIAAGVFEGLDGVHGLSGWRWLFILQGAVTIVAAVVAWFTLPNSPLQTRWLTPEERQLAHDRVAVDTTHRREGTSVWTGLREASSDYRTWLFALTGILHFSANGFKNFLPQLIKTFGYSDTVSLVLTTPPYLLSTVVSVLVSWTSGRYNERTWHITACKLVAIAGFIIAVSTLNIGARMFAVFLFVGATYGVNNINIAWVAATLGQTDEKKSVAIAIVNTVGNCASIFTPYLWPDSDSPRFLTAMFSSIAFCVGVIALTWLMRLVLMQDNRRIRQNESEAINFYAY
ncbi:hypothetical protein LTS08_008726 [Lithohypha guttulata]|nr:hypothetical protein LTS08_008726 [Lithohypha guttulata]